MTTETYGPAAYRGSALPTLPPPIHDKQGLFDTALKWGYYANLDSVSEVEGQLMGEAHLAYERQTREKRKQQIYCDAEHWNFENSGKLLHFLFILHLGCVTLFSMPWIVELAVIYDSMTIPIVGVIAMFTSLSLYGTSRPWLAYVLGGVLGIITAGAIAWDQGALWGYWSEQTAFWFGAVVLFMAVIGVDLLIGLYSLIYTHDGSGFNRRDGMLRIGRRFRSPFVAPFYEFDPVMQLQVTPHGGHDYVLWLHHRYTDTKVCLGMKMHSLGLDKANLYAFWDTLQRYMDVEQPLPDLPVLEQSRHLDPVTAAHDAAIGRPERYWRDRTLEGWKRNSASKTLREKLASHPWQQHPCTLRARIDASLSIEDYYRSQQARGIHAARKGGDDAVALQG
nr:sulfite exporter TauE/SafE family protein [Stutzerimonas stutzeri]